MADSFEIFFATNRDFNGQVDNPGFGPRFNDKGPQIFRVGTATVAGDGDDYTYQGARVAEETTDNQHAGSRELFGALRDVLKREQRDILLLIHGFASTFEECLERGANLQDKYRITPRDEETDTVGETYAPLVFVFSWPANGRVAPFTEYFSDRDDAQASGLAMARALIKLLSFLSELQQQDRTTRVRLNLSRMEQIPENERASCTQRIHLVAHSMGNWALRHAVNRFADEIGRRPLPRIFEHIFLMAADEDDDALENPLKLGLLPDLGKFIHVYHSRGDKALDVSNFTKGNPNRLGAGGPRNMDPINDRIFAIDCEKVDFTSLGDGNHQYYRLRKEVIADVRQVLSGVPFDRIEGRKEIKRARSFRILGNDER